MFFELASITMTKTVGAKLGFNPVSAIPRCTHCNTPTLPSAHLSLRVKAASREIKRSGLSAEICYPALPRHSQPSPSSPPIRMMFEADHAMLTTVQSHQKSNLLPAEAVDARMSDRRTCCQCKQTQKSTFGECYAGKITSGLLQRIMWKWLSKSQLTM
jgi:hypothetical protein